MRPKIRVLIIVAISVSVFPGCVSWHSGIKPEGPSSGIAVLPSRVTSLQPTITWEPFDQEKSNSIEDLRYQLIVVGTFSSFGDIVYAKKDILENSHTLETPLQPSTTYGWRIRPIYKKDGQETVGKWSGFNFIGVIPPYFGSVFGNPYFIKTP